VGRRDGDVLTRVAGAPATSVGAVVAAITGAWQAKARVLSAVVWRGGQQIQVAIELPRSG
jgi:S1-C subfamily serine protease